MFMTNITKRIAGLSIGMLTLVGCNMNTTSNPLKEAGFRQARFQEVMRIEAFDECKDEALTLDRQARSRESTGAYLTSATIMQKCNTDLSGDTRGVAESTRMRVGALATLNFLKGGDAEKARHSLEQFKTSFPKKDLYFTDGSSFVQTTELLLGNSGKIGFGRFSTMNVNTDVKNEMRRLSHWKNK